MITCLFAACSDTKSPEMARAEDSVLTEQPEKSEKPTFDIVAEDIDIIGGTITYERIGNNNRSLVVSNGWLYMTPFAESPLLAYRVNETESGAVNVTFERAFEMSTRLGGGGLSTGPDSTILFNTLGEIYQVKQTEKLTKYDTGRWFGIAYDPETNFGIAQSSEGPVSFSIGENKVISEPWAAWKPESLPEDWRIDRIRNIFIDGNNILLIGRLDKSHNDVLICIDRAGAPVFRSPSAIKNIDSVASYNGYYLILSIKKHMLRILDREGDVLGKGRIFKDLKPEYSTYPLASIMVNSQDGIFVLKGARLKDSDLNQTVLTKIHLIEK